MALATHAVVAAPDFIKDIQPILERNCVRCHGADKTKGGLRMDTHELIMEGGDTADAIVQVTLLPAKFSSAFTSVPSTRA